MAVGGLCICGGRRLLTPIMFRQLENVFALLSSLTGSDSVLGRSDATEIAPSIDEGLIRASVRNSCESDNSSGICSSSGIFGVPSEKIMPWRLLFRSVGMKTGSSGSGIPPFSTSGGDSLILFSTHCGSISPWSLVASVPEVRLLVSLLTATGYLTTPIG